MTTFPLNHQPGHRAETICVGVALAGFLVAAAPFWVGKEWGSGRFALVLIGATVGLTALVVIPYFRGRRRVAAELAAADDLLARWEFAPAEWNAWVAVDARRESRAKWQLFALVLGWSVVIGAGFAWADPGPGTVVLGVLVGLCGVIAVVNAAVLRRQRHRRLLGPSEVRIGRDGLRIGDELHVWRGFGARLESAGIAPGHPPVLEIVYSTRAKNQRQIHTVCVPIPRGEEGRAAEVAARLRVGRTARGAPEEGR